MKFAICFLVLLHYSQSLVLSPVVRIAQGELQGVIEDSIIGQKYVAFKGIPFAKPPVGDLRFRDPVPAGPWKSRLNASEFRPICPQLDLVTNEYTGDEDCLYLNVFTPPDFNPSRSPRKAVMFWIYGGSNTQGSGNDGFNAPDYIVAKDVILVTMNYRLGTLGFLNVEDEAATGNQAMKDQVLALKWVKKNIARFGGNPKSVTIFGESSGAASVHFLALSHMADGLYHKAIAQSGVALNPWGMLPYSPKISAQEVAAALGKETTNPKKLVNFLRTIDAIVLAKTVMNLTLEHGYGGLELFVPSVDSLSTNPFFPQPLDSVVRSGVKVPLMLGYMDFEGMLFLAGVDEEVWKQYNLQIERAFSPGVMKILRDKGMTSQELREIYFGDKNISEATRDNYVQMQSDLQFIYGIHDVAAIQASRRDCPTYMYRFTYDGGISIAKDAFEINMPGATHSDDLPYILYPKFLIANGVVPPQPGSKTRLVVDRVVQMWTDFAKYGNPTPAVTDLVPVIWEPVANADNFAVMNIGENLEMKMEENVNRRNAEKLRRLKKKKMHHHHH